MRGRGQRDDCSVWLGHNVGVQMGAQVFEHGCISIGWGGGKGIDAALSWAQSPSQDVFCAQMKMQFFMCAHDFSVGVNAKKKLVTLEHHPGQL